MTEPLPPEHVSWVRAASRRLHAALLPDYNGKAAAYWWTVVTLGLLALGAALLQVAQMPADRIWQIAIGAAVAMLAGMFPVRIPRSRNSFAAGEVYIFLLLALQGPAAAVIAASCEAALAVFRASKRWSSRIGSTAMAALAMTLCGLLYEAIATRLHASGALGPGGVVALLMALGALYSFANSVIVSTVFKLKAGQPLSPRGWVADWGWVGLTYVATAAIAGLLYLTFEQFGVAVLVVSVPMLATFLAALHYFFAQQEAAERERQARTEAAEREAAQSAAHVKALEASEKRFHSAFTHASSGMALVSVDGRVLQANLSFGALLGRDAVTLAGCQLTDFLFGGDAALLQEQFDRRLLARTAVPPPSGRRDLGQPELRLLRRVGRHRPLPDLPGARRDRAPPCRRTAAAHRLSRSADQPCQPQPLQRLPGAGAGDRPRRTEPALRGDVPGLRPLQADQ